MVVLQKYGLIQLSCPVIVRCLLDSPFVFTPVSHVNVSQCFLFYFEESAVSMFNVFCFTSPVVSLCSFVSAVSPRLHFPHPVYLHSVFVRLSVLLSRCHVTPRYFMIQLRSCSCSMFLFFSSLFACSCPESCSCLSLQLSQFSFFQFRFQFSFRSCSLYRRLGRLQASRAGVPQVLDITLGLHT